MMDELFEMPKPQLGYVILQSAPCTQEEGEMWLAAMARNFPEELFTKYSWVPIQPGEPN